MRHRCTHKCQLGLRIVKQGEYVDIPESEMDDPQIQASFAPDPIPSDESKDGGEDRSEGMLSRAEYAARLDAIGVAYPARAGLDKLKQIYDEQHKTLAEGK